MSEYLINLNNGKTDEKGILRLLGKLLPQNGVIETAGMTVSAQSSPDMTVKVSGSAASDNCVFINSSGDTYHGWNTANYNVTITSNSSGVTKKDTVIAYADTAGGISTSNNPGALKFIAVRGSGTDTAPTDGELNTATSNKPWIRLANVQVANGASSINSGNITDVRTKTAISDSMFSAFKLGYAEVTAAQNSLGTGPTDLTSLSITVTAPTTRGIKITAFIPVTCNATGQQLLLEIKEGSTVLQTSSVQNSIASVQNGVTATMYITSPSGGSHTYKLTTETAGGTWNMNASSTKPAFILAEAL